jgi:hypothetical protein
VKERNTNLLEDEIHLALIVCVCLHAWLF